MRKGRLTDAEKYFIDKMVADRMPVDEMAKKLERTKTTISAYLDSIMAQKPPESPINKIKPESFIVTKTAGKERGGVAIMTEAASMRGDAKPPTGPTRTLRESCFTIFPNDQKKRKN